MAQQDNVQVSFGIKGMNRQTFSHNIDEKVYSFMSNGNIESNSESIGLTNEASNFLCSKFKPGYTIIGHKYDSLNSKVWFFLTQKETYDKEVDGKIIKVRNSEIGFIKTSINAPDLSDFENECGCDIESILSAPLEELENSVEYCTYTTLIDDNCNNCLNFDPNFPVHNIILKQEACGFTMTFATKNNPPRYIILDRISDYKFKGDINCGIDEREDVCIDCEKLRLFPIYEQPYITPEIINYGGNLKRGIYEYYIAYCDKMGNELSSYTSATNPVSVFDKDDIQLNQSTRFDNTNLAIKLTVRNLDKRFNFYKIVVIEKTDVNEITSTYEEGIHSISDVNVTHTSSGSQNDKRVNINKLFVEKPIYKNFGGLTTSNGILFGYDYEVEKEWNLQPMVNLLGSFVKWQTVEGTENLYKDGVNVSKFKSFMRDEVYPLGIQFKTNDGYNTAVFPLMSRPSTSYERVDVANPPINQDVRSLLENAGNCSQSDRNHRWQFYNTGSVLGYSFSNINYSSGKIINKNVENTCVQENVKEYNNIEIDIDLETDFYGLEDYVLVNAEDICQAFPPSDIYNAQLCEMITDNVTQPCDIENSISFLICDDYNDCYDKYCDVTSPDYSFEKCKILERNCIDGECTGICSDFQPISSNLYISEVLNEKIELYEKRYPWVSGPEEPYEHNYSKTNCILKNLNSHIRGDVDVYDNAGNVVDQESIQFSPGEYYVKNIPNFSDNIDCKNALTLPAVSQFINSEIVGNIMFSEFPLPVTGGNTPRHSFVEVKNKESIKGYNNQPAGYSLTKNDLLSDVNATPINGFENKILKTGMWYKVEFKDNNKMLFEVTPIENNGSCNQDSTNSSDNIVRYTIYDKCKNGSILHYGTYNAEDGLFLVLQKSIYGKKEILIALDTKIIYKQHSVDHIQNRPDDGKYIRTVTNKFYYATSLCGCFDVVIRDKEYYKAKIKADKVSLNKKTIFESTCKFNAPTNQDCGVVPHKYGLFSYWKSSEEYPDNSDLYDSSVMKINMSKLNHEDLEIKDIFNDYYSNGIDSNGNIIFKEKNGKSLANFVCEPIHHYKFPDNSVIPFMSSESLMDFANSNIYPIGVTIDEKTIDIFLDFAVDSNLISKEQRNRITGYEIFRGDRSVNKSVIYKGIANDMYEDLRTLAPNQRTFFRNFPYNTLGKNPLVTTDRERTQLVKHPFPSSSKNNRFSLIAPEVYYNRPKSPSEMSVEGYMYGKSVSNYLDVKNHSEWVILGDKAHSLAGKLANAEIVLEGALNIATLTIESSKNFWFSIGFANGGNPVGAIASAVALGIYAAIEVVNLVSFKYPKLKTQWLEIFEQRGSVYNFASMQVSSKGFYNSFKPTLDYGNKVRGLVTSKYLSNGTDAITEVEGNTATVSLINNKDRENSIYLYTGSDYPINYPTDYSTYDNFDISDSNSSRYIPSTSTQANSIRNIASPYFSLKNYVPDQYGKIDEIKWLSLNHDSKLENDSKNIFGGDIFISRVDLKNKVRLFNKDAIDLVNRIPFKYSTASNIGYTRFYVDHKSADEDVSLVNDMPYLSSTYNLNNLQGGRKFYEGNPSKFYLFSYGVPYFLVESEINNNLRYAGDEPHEQFASRGLNVDDWVQEANVSIAYNNIFLYNSVYSRNQTGIFYRTLPAIYDRSKWDCLAEAENGVAWSQEDNSEVSLSDPWLVFKPFNIYRFPFSFGKLISLNAIESVQVMGRFANNMAVFNAVDVLKERITPENEELGTGGIFAQRPTQFSFTELGETGSQHKSMVSTEFGHFWVDAKRGKIFQLEPNAKGLTAISDFSKQGEESGMRKWFKRHLPFKILNQNISNLQEEDIDNHFKGLGILMWWDSRFKRVFITKKDYVVRKQYKDKIEFSGGNFYYLDGEVNIEIKVQDSTYFKDVSWTVAYSPIYNNWVSYYDFKPDYAIAYNDYFQTGLNYSKDRKEEGLWSHLLTNKSYQVFYGKKYPWIIEVPIKNSYTNNVLKDLNIWTTSQRYHNNNDYAVWRKKSFNKLIVYNQTNNSGLLHLNYDDSMNKSKYPIKISNYEQGIQASSIDEQIKVNYFYNRVKKEDNHIPIWNSDENEIYKELNSDAISFNSKRVLERLRGDWFLVRLIQDSETRFQNTFKWMVSVQQGYQ